MTRLLAVLCLASAAHLTAQQVPDTTHAGDTTKTDDSVVVRLAPVEVQGSIAPVASSTIGSAIPARISVVSSREIAAWQPRTAADLLSAQAGVSLYDDLGSPYKLNLSTRGFNVGPTVGLPSGVSVFLDGVRQNEPDAQEVNFDLLPMEHVERVEILSGPASLLGPNSLGGAVNLVTRRGDGPLSGALELSTDSFGAAAASGWVAGSRESVHHTSDYYLGGGYEREKGWRDATGARNYNVFGNAGRRDATRGITIQAYGALSRAETAGSLPESIFDAAPRTNFTAGDFEDLDVAQLSVSGYAPVTIGRGAFTAYVRRSTAERFNVNQAPDENVRSRSINGSVGGNADWRWAAPIGGGVLAFRVGLDGSTNQVRARIFNNPGADPSSDVLTTDVRSASADLAGYTIADAHLGRASLSGGARGDYIRVPFRNVVDPADRATNSFRHFSPRAGLSVDLGGGASAYTSFGESFRAPAILELGCADPSAACPLPFALGDDPPLQPVRATTYEAGMRWGRRGFSVDGSVYRTAVRDEIFFIASNTTILSGYFTNIPRTRREGAELSARGSLWRDRVLAYGNYSYNRATFETATQIFSIRSNPGFSSSPLAGPNAVSPGDRLPLIPDHQVKGGALARLPGGIDLGVDARYSGRQWSRGDEANETRPLAAYFVTNARLGLERGGWEAALLTTNLFDVHAATFGTFNENRQTGKLERFLTPVTTRAIKLVIERAFGR